MTKKLFNRELVNFLFLYCLKSLIKKGSKIKYFAVFSQFISLVKRMTKKDPFLIILKSIENVEPFCEVKNLKIRGLVHKVPVAVYPKRQKYLAIKFLIMNAKMRNEKKLHKRLTLEFLDAFLFTGNSMKNCIELHKIAETNKIFAQFKN